MSTLESNRNNGPSASNVGSSHNWVGSEVRAPRLLNSISDASGSSVANELGTPSTTKTGQHRCTEVSCSKTFTSLRDVRRHVKSVHIKHCGTCPRCSKRLGSRSDNLKRTWTSTARDR